MNIIKGYVLVSQAEIDKKIKAAEKAAFERGSKESKSRIEELEKALERKVKDIDRLRNKYQDDIDAQDREIGKLKTTIEVLEEERAEAKDVIKQSIANDETENILNARKEAYDKREAKLKDREAKLEDAEDAKSKTAYADGLADGLRKAHEITQTDRDNAMKIAMVSAASHTPVDTMKELNSAHQLTTGSREE